MRLWLTRYLGFFAALRNEVSTRHGITITVACPGPVKTEINNTRLVGHSGKSDKNIDMDNAQPVEVSIFSRRLPSNSLHKDAVTKILNGVRKGHREVLFVPAPPLFKLILAFAPALMDRILLKQWEKITTDNS